MVTLMPGWGGERFVRQTAMPMPDGFPATAGAVCGPRQATPTPPPPAQDSLRQSWSETMGGMKFDMKAFNDLDVDGSGGVRGGR